MPTHLRASDVAEYFLASVDEDSGDNLTNLKLQKLLYYAQGFHLALHGEPLFSDPILAWQHGPVVYDLWRSYTQYGSNALPKPDCVDFEKFSPSTKDLLDEVFSVYGQYSAWKLRDMTHEEPPWSTTEPNCVIPQDAMRDFFKTLIVHG